MLTYTTLFAIAFLLTFLLTPLVRAGACWAGVFDVPDGRRKLHARPIPRLGGLAVVLGFYASLFLMLQLTGDSAPPGTLAFARGMLGPSLLVLGIGIIDDLWSVKPSVKLAVQVAAGLWVYYVLDIRIHLLANPFGGESMLGALSLPATLLWIALVTNAFNIVDGMDGLAAGVSLIASTCVFLVSLQQQNAEIAFFAAPLAGAALGFLKYNFNPASIFLGDTGSLFLGFQLAVLSIAGSQKSSTAIAIITPLLMLAFPLIETTISMARRFLRGEPIMQADRGHIHHQLLRLGLTPRRAVLLLYLGSALFGVTSLFLVQRDAAVIGITAVALAMLTWLGIQWLGYAEFIEINNAFKRVFLYQRRVIQRNIHIRKLADELRGAVSLDVASDLVASVAEELGFSHVMLKCGRPEAVAAALERQPATFTMPDVSRHTVMSIVLAGRTGEVGELVLGRSRRAEPLQSELPVFIDAITSTLPAIVEQAVTAWGDAGAAKLMMVHSPSERHRRRHLQPAAVAPRVLRRFPVRLAPEVASASVGDLALLQPCLHCGELALARSHSRNMAERVRKLMSRTRLHRCSACGWRGWVFVLVNFEAEAQQPPWMPDLSALDHNLAHAQPMRAAL